MNTDMLRCLFAASLDFVKAFILKWYEHSVSTTAAGTACGIIEVASRHYLLY